LDSGRGFKLKGPLELASIPDMIGFFRTWEIFEPRSLPAWGLPHCHGASSPESVEAQRDCSANILSRYWFPYPGFYRVCIPIITRTRSGLLPVCNLRSPDSVWYLPP